MKILKIFPAVALLALTACSGNETEETQPQGELLQLTASCDTYDLNSMMTRAVEGVDVLYNAQTGFLGGETVKVYFNNSNANYTVGVADATDGYKSTLYDGQLRYPSTTSGTADLYAVYPAASAAAGSHTVAYNQTGAEAYRQSDLMFAKKEISLSNHRVTHNLEFAHQLVKMRFVVTKGSDIPAITKLEMKNVKRTVAITPTASALTQGAKTTATGGDNLLVFSGSIDDTQSHTYVVVFPAQDWTGNDFLEMTTADSHVYTFTLEKNDWQNGYEYTLNLAVENNYLGAKVSITNWLNGGEVPAVDTGAPSGN